MIVLFDTNCASYWRGGSKPFEFPLKALIGELRHRRATFVLSTVSLHEILVFSRLNGSLDNDYQFLVERFTFLPFDEPCAMAAAKLAAQVGSPNRAEARKARGGEAPQHEMDLWHRDAAIAGTAEHHGLDLLVTADGPLHRVFRLHLTRCEVRLLEPRA